ncbi:DUF378 domain-containing protein [bacterium (Candidatus Gribaldobacteria) CG23_combo_of_CG06-09_8_20_14_all_37_87_8]|uniref:DUF378 domain-containing protein n=2 Tax=Candidatus Gribaldobacteria TaxID=2798536 RepID=A0A2G9ZHE4_9BACT|nr:MAG: DUF378 domain-containing protein [Parcubacteria group bacterium CG1_02_37_13]PIP31990.1 MAG: DUF378 domain-containing protein [bacterium (Candidatus Gribaldobacteria) CG23_combo_of_CG06-09_8_20_14_all_37_87_8]PIR89842.1 MAG: DUF378 domain-containing protein [bacterium (Candidatus Gribaldobacteria) CG10_big_fil_rev_8_21_14_0_10_37_21]
MSNKKLLETIVFILVVVGGLNWGLVGLFKIDVVAVIFGEMAALTRIIYVAVGLSAAYKLATKMKVAKK